MRIRPPTCRRAQLLVQPHTRHRRGERRHLEDAALQTLLELAPHLCGVSQAEHGGKPDPLVRLESSFQLAHDRVAEGRQLESPGEAEAADVGVLAERRRQLGRARRHSSAGAAEVVGEVRGVEILEPEADEKEAAAAAKATAEGFTAPTAVGSRKFSSSPPSKPKAGTRAFSHSKLSATSAAGTRA
jgi:hypothetical protein